MKKQDVKLVFSVNDYFETVRFFQKTKIDQIAYMLYYVTKVAQLRCDMQPQIITQRINDQIIERKENTEGYGVKPNSLKENEVEKIMQEGTDYFQVSNFNDERDRKDMEDKTAYQLTDGIIEKFDKEFNKKMIRLYERRGHFENIWFLLIFASLFSFSVLTFSHYYNMRNRTGISFPEFRERIKFDYATDERKAVYFLFFMTEIERLKQEVYPEIISRRLYDVANLKITGEDIKNYFRQSDNIIESKIEGMYRIASNAKSELFQKIGIVDRNFFIILSESFVFNELLLAMGILGTIILSVFSVGFLFGRKLPFLY